MNVYELTFRCPDIKTQEDAEILRETLADGPGVGMIEVDWRTKIVQVVTSNQDAGRDVLKRLIDAGYRPED